MPLYDPAMELRLDGKAVLVTGGSKGIGLAIGQVCAAAGARVLLSSRKQSQLEEAAATVKGEVYEGIDSGPIIAQESVSVLPGDTPESLAARVLEAEHRIYPRALRRVAEEKH